MCTTSSESARPWRLPSSIRPSSFRPLRMMPPSCRSTTERSLPKPISNSSHTINPYQILSTTTTTTFFLNKNAKSNHKLELSNSPLFVYIICVFRLCTDVITAGSSFNCAPTPWKPFSSLLIILSHPIFCCK